MAVKEGGQCWQCQAVYSERHSERVHSREFAHSPSSWCDITVSRLWSGITDPTPMLCEWAPIPGYVPIIQTTVRCTLSDNTGKARPPSPLHFLAFYSTNIATISIFLMGGRDKQEIDTISHKTGISKNRFPLSMQSVIYLCDRINVIFCRYGTSIREASGVGSVMPGQSLLALMPRPASFPNGGPVSAGEADIVCVHRNKN